MVRPSGDTRAPIEFTLGLRPAGEPALASAKYQTAGAIPLPPAGFQYLPRRRRYRDITRDVGFGTRRGEPDQASREIDLVPAKVADLGQPTEREREQLDDVAVIIGAQGGPNLDDLGIGRHMHPRSGGWFSVHSDRRIGPLEQPLPDRPLEEARERCLHAFGRDRPADARDLGE